MRYTSIAISGPPGSGRSTLLKNLAPIFKPKGWEIFSGGEWSRKVAIEEGAHAHDTKFHHNAMAYGRDIDLVIDEQMRDRVADKNNHVLIESWIAGWNTRKLMNVLKVLLTCDESLRIDRVVNRDDLTVDEAKTHIRERERVNFDKWEMMYGARDFWSPAHYNIVIDTYKNSPAEVTNIVLKNFRLK